MRKFEEDSVEQVLDSYCEFLAATQEKSFYQKFIKRWEQDTEAAKSEAIVYTWACASNLNPTINEKPNIGGADFLCSPEVGSPFLLEVTVIKSEAIGRQSLLLNDIFSPGGAYRLITVALNNKVRSKWNQMNKSASLPRVLAICSLHSMSHLVLGREAARSLLISEQFISCPLTEDGFGPGVWMTDFKNSVFFKIDDQNKVNLRNQVISAILLFPIFPDRVAPLGVLHPNPSFPLDKNSLHLVPIIGIEEWPIQNNQVKTLWTYEISPSAFYHKRVRLSESEKQKLKELQDAPEI